MSGNNHALTAFQTRQNGFVPVRHNALDGQRRAFGNRQLFIGQFCITRIVARVALVVFWSAPAGNGKATAPLFNLLIAVLLSGFSFVQTLQCPVVTLVQFPDFSTGSQA